LRSQDDLPENLRIKGCITLEDLFGLPTESRKVQEFAKAMRRDEEKTCATLFLRLFARHRRAGGARRGMRKEALGKHGTVMRVEPSLRIGWKET
jgi:hypothetical protein